MSNTRDETLLEFPCEFPIKAFGLAADGFPDRVLQIVRQRLAEDSAVAMQYRCSQGGKYTAVTITIEASSKAQLDAIYEDLTACPQVIMAL